MSEPVTANLGGWIGRGIANGDPAAWGAAVGVIVAFVVAYRLMVWWRME